MSKIFFPKLVGFLGRRRRGKDTAANYLQRKGYICYSFAAVLKEYCEKKYMLSNEQLNGELKEVKDEKWRLTPREILQKEGDVGRKTSQFVKAVEKFIIENKEKFIVITDCRHQDEVDLIRKMGGIVIKITRPLPPSIHDDHSSEEGIDNIVGDVLINNDGTVDELHEKIEKILST